MEWLVTILTAFGLLVLFAPLIALLVTFFVLVPLAHLLPQPKMIARVSFTCPVSRRRVSAAFLTAPGPQAPSDVLSCSLFAGGEVRCKKGCLGLAETLWERRPVVARFALLADGEVARN